MKKTSDVQWLRAGFAGPATAVDREAKVLRGYVVAQEGPFKSDGRGEFDRAAIEDIARLGNAASRGLKSRWTHGTVSGDSAGDHLGRSKNFTVGQARDARTGRQVSAVRADLHFHQTAFKIPVKEGSQLSRAEYIFQIAETDPEALSSSLVIEADEEPQRDGKGKLLTDEHGDPLPPLWRPKKLHASDIVEMGDAVDALLSADELTHALSVGLTPELRKVLHFDNVARLAAQMLDGLFPSKSREEVEQKCRAWLGRYLEMRFPGATVLAAMPAMECPMCGTGMQCPECQWKSGDSTAPSADMPMDMAPTPNLEKYRLRLDRMSVEARSVNR